MFVQGPVTAFNHTRTDMSTKHNFLLQIPINGKRLKYAVISLLVTLIACIAGIIVSSIFYDDYTEVVTTITGRERVIGWPATVGGWSRWLAVAIVLSLPFMIFMQDWRNPSLGLTAEGLFINQQMIRNTLVPYDNIAQVSPDGKGGFTITFRDSAKIVSAQVFLFRPFVKSNLGTKALAITSMYSKGDLEGFAAELRKKTGQA